MGALVSFILGVLMVLVPSVEAAPVFIPPMPLYAPLVSNEDAEWDAYHCEAFLEYEDEFTALFNSYECKRAKNGAMMIRQGNSGSFKFAKKG